MVPDVDARDKPWDDVMGGGRLTGEGIAAEPPSVDARDRPGHDVMAEGRPRDSVKAPPRLGPATFSPVMAGPDVFAHLARHGRA